MAIKGAHGDKDHIAPHLIVRKAAEVVEFYKRALGAVELYRSALPGGLGMHFHLRIGNSFVMVTDEAPPTETHTIDDTIVLKSPQSLGGTSVVLEILVDDVDAAYTRALVQAQHRSCQSLTVSGATAMDGYATRMGTFGLWRRCWKS